MGKITDTLKLVGKTILYILAYIAKNVALVVGIFEALAKLLAGLINIFASAKQKDKLLSYVDIGFSWVKKWIYFISDKMSGLEVPDIK